MIFTGKCPACGGHSINLDIPILAENILISCECYECGYTFSVLVDCANCEIKGE